MYMEADRVNEELSSLTIAMAIKVDELQDKLESVESKLKKQITINSAYEYMFKNILKSSQRIDSEIQQQPHQG